MHCGLVFDRCSDEHWNAMRNTTFNPQNTLIALVPYKIRRYLISGITASRRISSEPFAVTSDSTLKIRDV